VTILVGVDGSPASRVALREAAQEARWRKASLVAVATYELPLGTPAGGYPAATKHTESENRATAETALRNTLRDELGDQAREVDLRVSGGLAGHVIIETARHAHADLIVLAASAGKVLVPGTVSHHVLSKAECKVMLVPGTGQDS
jgi:nucleotide-binding universal stress UspA family protein